MLDPLSLLAGAALVIGGYGSGRIGRARRHPRPPKPVKPFCGCGHHHSFHTEEGRCSFVTHQLVEEKELQRTESGKVVRDAYDEPVFVKKVKDTITTQCGCQRYSGPEPIPSYYAPEIGG